jgi:hypothetical protein
MHTEYADTALVDEEVDEHLLSEEKSSGRTSSLQNYHTKILVKTNPWSSCSITLRTLTLPHLVVFPSSTSTLW